MEDALKFYEKARKISDSILPFAKKLVVENAHILDIAEKIEEKIEERGGKPAFPVNISINNIAAHYTPSSDDPTTLKQGDLVKIDYGVHVEGYIWDRAFSMIVGDGKNVLIEAAEKSVERALKAIRPGIMVKEISEVIEETLEEYEVVGVRNLCGHGLERYVEHAPPTIPCVRNDLRDVLEEGKVVAIEVFTTNGSGYVKEADVALIYKFVRNVPVRYVEARRVLKLAREVFQGLPFAKRWLEKYVRGVKLELALSELVEKGAIRAYPVLREIKGALVAQHEESKIVK